MYVLAAIREELKSLLPTYSIANSTWRIWKDLVGIEDGSRTCTHEQYVSLFAIAALKRKRERPTKLAIRKFVRENGDNPMAFFPGYIPVDRLVVMPELCEGRQLAIVFESVLGNKPSERTLQRWVKTVLNCSYSRNRIFTKSELQELFRHYVKLRDSDMERFRKNGKDAVKRFWRKKQQSAA